MNKLQKKPIGNVVRSKDGKFIFIVLDPCKKDKFNCDFTKALFKNTEVWIYKSFRKEKENEFIVWDFTTNNRWNEMYEGDLDL